MAGAAVRSSRVVGWVASLKAAARREPTSALFFIYVAVSFPLIVLRIGRFHWFFRDEWAFLAGRDLTVADDWFRPHNEHWDTVGVIVFRVLYAVFGLRTYVPYQAVGVLSHLLVVVALFFVIRRAVRSPGVAAAAAGAFVLFGPGSQNILSGFQIAFTGAVGFALVHMLLLDHDGPWSRRDWWGLGSGAIALMCSGLAVPMTLGSGAIALVRRGPRIAALHSAPLAVMYGIWFAVYRPGTSAGIFGRPPKDELLSFVWSGELGGAVAIGRWAWLTLGMVMLAGVGLLLAALRPVSARSRQTLVTPVVLLVVGVVNLVLIAQGRWWSGDEFARSERYVYVTAALMLPALAVGLEAVLRSVRLGSVVVAALLLVAAPGNAVELRDGFEPFDAGYHQESEELTRTLPRLDLFSTIDPTHDPFGIDVSPWLTVGFLTEAVAAGDLAVTRGEISPRREDYMNLLLVVAPRPADGEAWPCEEWTGVVEFTTNVDQELKVVSPVEFAYVRDGEIGRRLVVRANWFSPAVVAFNADDQPLSVRAVDGGPFQVCESPE